MKTGKDWIHTTNVYEVNLRQYTEEGSFKAFEKHLPRLADMGVETLWFMPLTPIAQKNKKGSMGSYYACADYTSINSEFGTKEDLHALLDKAKELGFKILIDWVANHTGWDHTWTNAHPDWYKKDSHGDFLKASGMDDIIELDFNNQHMRNAMIDAMRWWVKEFDIDGFRCDLASWVVVDFWAEAKNNMDSLKDLFWFAEADPLESSEYMQVFDAAYTWKWMHRTKDFYEGKTSLHELTMILAEYIEAPGIPAWFTSNHDENSWNGTEFEKYGRLATALSVFGFCFPGIPLLYSGQELPNRKRLQFFEKDRIEWNDQPTLHGFYKNLIALKKNIPALHVHASYKKIRTSADDKVFSFLRKFGQNEVLVIINFSGEEQQIAFRDPSISGKYRDFISEEEKEFSSPIQIPSWAYFVYIK